ncbi:MAG: sulfate reduction electron transfer complex DsrMKJOP subunit DsrO [Magnetospiraceae bacterium]
MTANRIDEAKRRFLGGLAAISGMVVAPGVTLTSPKPAAAAPRDPATPVTDAKRWGMLVDTNKCPEGCSACVTACKTENGWQGQGRPRTDSQWIRKVTVQDKTTGHQNSFPVMCQHCEDPPCADVCPTGASFKRADGIVLVDKHICIGCRYCMMACPYKARSFVHEPTSGQRAHAPRGKGTVESCTFCVHRVDAGQQPACVEACGKTGNNALSFGDLKDPESALSKDLAEHGGRRIREDLGLNQGVLYRGV